MRRLLTGAMIAALALALTASAHAGRGGGRAGGGMIRPAHTSGHPHYTGGRFNQGQYKCLASYKFTGQKHGKHWWFRGRNGHHWSRTGWSYKHNRQCYWNADTGGWYYFDDDQDAYRPLAELDDDAPNQGAADDD